MNLLIKFKTKLTDLQLIRVAQRITRSATNREIAGSNPVTDNDIFFLDLLMQSFGINCPFDLSKMFKAQ